MFVPINLVIEKLTIHNQTAHGSNALAGFSICSDVEGLKVVVNTC